MQKSLQMLKHKTSVLFVNAEGKDNKTLQVPTNILLHWRKILLGLVAVIFALMGILSVFVYHSASEDYKQKLAKVNKVKSLIDVKKAQQTFRSIDESMDRINTFLSQRGLKKLELENVGGEVNFEVVDIDEIADYYEDQIKALENVVKITPMGRPLSGKITSKFGYRGNPFDGKGAEKHMGLDFRGRMGEPVKTTAEGTVEFAGRKGGYGNCIIIKHSSNLKTLYAHLSKINVKVNQKVTVGQIIGNVGSTGRSTGPHLHYEVIANNKKVNPEPYTYSVLD